MATDVEGCPGGLLAEARTRRRESSRLPWSCRAARDVAVEVIGEPELRLPARTRRMLHHHVAGTPYLKDREVFRVDLVGVPDPGEPARPVFKGHRAVWDIPFIPVWLPVEESTLGSFREAAADGDGPLALPFASLKARDWWADRNNHGHLARQRAGRGTQTDRCDPVPRPVAAGLPWMPR